MCDVFSLILDLIILTSYTRVRVEIFHELKMSEISPYLCMLLGRFKREKGGFL